jgi:hypothetical protein
LNTLKEMAIFSGLMRPIDGYEEEESGAKRVGYM